MSDSDSSRQPEASRRRRDKAVGFHEKPQWLLGRPGGKSEVLAGLAVFLTGLAVIWLEPGAVRPYHHLAVALAGLNSLGAAYFLARYRLNSRSALTLIALALWYLCVLASALGTTDSYRTVATLSGWSAGAVSFLLAALAFSSGGRWRQTLGMLILAAFSLCISGLVGREPGQALKATFGNQDTFCVIPMTAVFLSLALAQSPQQKTVSLAGAVFFAMMTLATGSRAGALGLILGTAGLMGALAQHRDQAVFKRASRLLGRGLIVLLGFSVASGTLQALGGRFAGAFNGQDIQGVTMRHDVLVRGLEASSKHPLTGTGPGTFALTYQEYRPAGVVPDDIYVNYAHNDYIEFLVEIGWPGFLCWLLFTSLVMVRAIRLVRFSIASWEASCLLAALVSSGCFSCLNFIIPIPGVFIWQMLILGLLQGLPAAEVGHGDAPPWQYPLAAIVLAVGLLSSFTSYVAFRSALLLRSAKVQELALRWEEAVQSLDAALAWQPTNLEALLDRGRSLSRLGAFQNKKDYQHKGEADLLRAAQLSPRDQEVARHRIQIYASTGQLAQAEAVAGEMARIAGYRHAYVESLVRFQILQGKLESAARSLYLIALDDRKARAGLPAILAQLENEHAETSLNLLREWSDGEGETGVSLDLALKASRIVMAGKVRNLVAAKRFLKFVLSKDKDRSEALYILATIEGLEGHQKIRLSLLEGLAAQAESKKSDEFIDKALADLAAPHLSERYSPYLVKVERRLKSFPKSVPLRLSLTEAYLRQRKFESATETASEGVDVLPENPVFLARLGTCFAAQGLADLSRSQFEQALKLDPRNKEARKGLASLTGK